MIGVDFGLPLFMEPRVRGRVLLGNVHLANECNRLLFSLPNA